MTTGMMIMMIIGMFVPILIFIVIIVALLTAQSDRQLINYVGTAGVNFKNYDEKFEQFYNRIKDTEQGKEIEKLRIKAREERDKKIFKAILGIGIVFSVFVLIAMVSPFLGSVIVLMFPFYIPLIIIICLIKNRKKPIKETAGGSYARQYKEYIINELIKNFEDNVNYMPLQGMPTNVYREAEFERFDRYSSDDYMELTLKNKCNAQMAEVHTEYKSTDKDGHTHYYTLFRGIFAKIDTPKPFNQTFYLRKDAMFGRRAINPASPKIKLDSPEFEKYFDVYGSNKIVAVQLLTADIMQMLVEFRNYTKIRYDLSIKDNKLYLRFFTGMMFETPSLMTAAFDKNTLYKYYKLLDFTFNLTYKIMKVIEETEY